MSRIGKSTESESRLVAAWREGKLGTATGNGVSFCDENVVKLDCADGCTTL